MSLSGTLQVGKTALAVTQAAIQTHGNNIAGASDPNYTRQVARVGSSPGRQLTGNAIVGTGISLEGIDRQIDDALVRRLNSAVSDGEAAKATLDWLKQVESAFNELTDADLSTAASELFNAFGELAGDPADAALRGNVIAAAENVASRFNDISSRLTRLRSDTGERLGSYASQADSLMKQIAELNVEVVKTEGGGNNGSANALRDRRDGLVGELAQLVNVHAIEQVDGSLNIYAGSQPLVMSGTTRGMTLDQRIDPNTGRTTFTPLFGDGGGPVPARAGALGGTLTARDTIDETLDRLDALAAGLAFEVNRLHSTGQGVHGYDSITSDARVNDPTAALDSDDAGLAFTPQNGSFVLHLRDKGTGRTTSTIVDVPLDGTPGGTSLDDLTTSINTIGGVSASVVNGRLQLSADSPAQELTFGEDTSNVLAALGVGGLFTGSGASDLGINAAVKADPLRLAISRDNTPGGNGTAIALSQLADKGLDSLQGATLAETYEATVFELAASIRSAETDAEAAGAVAETLETQRQALSGVSLDEEAVALLRYQRSYQGAARLIAAVDEMMQTLLQLV